MGRSPTPKAEPEPEPERTNDVTKIALITGANRGLGFEVARQLGRLGVKSLLGARDPEKGAQAAAQLATEGLDAESIVLDVESVSSVEAAAEQVTNEYGGLDILVNNAGILPEATTPDATKPLDLRLFRRTFEVNLFGAVAVTQNFLPLLRRSPAGRIVNVSTTMGSLSDQTNPSSPYYGLVVPAYQTSKAALNGITIALAKTLADTPIKINSICPGWVQTDLGGPDNRAAAPLRAEEAAGIVVTMACLPDDGPTGQFVDRDGTVPW
jgi:NAD(P)-dependent dehydrogenase (short-subunit alcohol dehydrogenase family)